MYITSDGHTVGLAHDYLTQRGGAERVVLAMSRAFPGAPVHTTLYDRTGTYPEFTDIDVRTSLIDRVGPLRRSHRVALPLLPLAASSLRPGEDVVIASTSGWAHGFSATGRIIAYCHAPARWLYQSENYLGGPLWRTPPGAALGVLKPALTRWDRSAARRPERYLCNSRVVRDRIREAYEIDAEVVPAPHGMDPYGSQDPVASLEGWADDGYLLVVSRLMPYKNVDVVVEAVRGTDQRLVIVGAGPGRDTLMATMPANVQLVSGLNDAQMRWVYAHSSMLVAPSLEDYGLTPLEAAAFGRPSVTLRAGGYLDTVIEGVTGLHVDSPDAALFRAGLMSARSHSWDVEAIRSHAEQFSEAGFAARLHAEVNDLLSDR
jgi:glycosyltransferase involved in cell wall biosynthesis